LGFFVALLLPVLYTEIPILVVNRRRFRFKSVEVPPHVQRRAAIEARLAPYASVLALGAVLGLVIPRSGVHLAEIGFNQLNYRRAILSGVIGALMWLLIYVILLLSVRQSRTVLSRHLLLQESAAYWLPLGLLAAIVEEIWRSFCLVDLRGYGNAFALATTSVAVAWAHLYPKARALSTAASAIGLGVLFLWTGSLWATIPAHAVLNAGTLVLQYWFRQHSAEEIGRVD